METEQKFSFELDVQTILNTLVDQVNDISKEALEEIEKRTNSDTQKINRIINIAQYLTLFTLMKEFKLKSFSELPQTDFFIEKIRLAEEFLQNTPLPLLREECMLSAAYALQEAFVLLAKNPEDTNLAVKIIPMSSRLLGQAKGIYEEREETELNKKLFYQKAANKRHSENKEMKIDVIAYYKANHASFKNKDDAALHISKKITPAKFSTVRGWLKGVKPE